MILSLVRKQEYAYIFLDLGRLGGSATVLQRLSIQEESLLSKPYIS